MTTSGVQMTGVRSAVKVAGNAKTAERAAGGSSFADMVSSNLSARRDGTSAQPKAERPDGACERVDAQPKAEPVSDAKEASKAFEKDPAAQADAQEQEKMPPEGVTDEGMQDGVQTKEESGAIDTQFPKSLKLFKEAARFLEAQKLNELKQAVMDSLEIDEEELAKILEQLGANMQQLVQPQILQAVVVAVQGAGDATVLLTSETAMDDLKELLAKAQELMPDQEMPEVSPDTKEGMEPVRSLEEQAPEFEELFVKAQMPQETAVRERQEKPADVQRGVEAGKPQTVEKPGFTFEAVKEVTQTGQASEEPSDGRSEAGDAKARPGSMAEQFLNLVTNAVPKDEVEFSQLSRSEQVREVAQQILERVRVFVGEAQTSMEISLTPESLGRVTLNLVSRQGALTAHFTAQNQIAKEAIESQIVVLRENLESQGLKVEAIEVTVSNFDFTQNGGAAANGGGQENRQRRRGVTFEEAVNAEGNPVSMREAEEIAADMLERSGNQVDYTA